MTLNQRVNIVLIILACFVVLYGLLSIADERQAELMIWAKKYEACVQREYRLTPSQYYAEVGEYPTCDVRG